MWVRRRDETSGIVKQTTYSTRICNNDVSLWRRVCGGAEYGSKNFRTWANRIVKYAHVFSDVVCVQNLDRYGFIVGYELILAVSHSYRLQNENKSA